MGSLVELLLTLPKAKVLKILESILDTEIVISNKDNYLYKDPEVLYKDIILRKTFTIKVIYLLISLQIKIYLWEDVKSYTDIKWIGVENLNDILSLLGGGVLNFKYNNIDAKIDLVINSKKLFLDINGSRIKVVDINNWELPE